MNNQRRQQIEQAKVLLAQVETLLTQARDDEQAYYDNMPESIQAGAKGDQAQQAADDLSEALDSMESIADVLDRIE